MDAVWASIVAYYHPAVVEFVGTHFVQLVFFWTLSGAYIALDHYFPAFSAAHKLQPTTRQPRMGDVWHCFQIVLRNQLMASTFHLALLYLESQVLDRPSLYDYSPTLPTLFVISRDVLICALLREALFYYSHRLLHLPALYSHVHKFHHRFTAPIALAAQYAHPVEHFLANILPLALPPAILHTHIVTWWIFLAIELVETSTVHSGYDFFGWAKMHDLHHETFRVNFGTVGILDYLHGTYGHRSSITPNKGM